jgi:hypothetical protein
MREGRCHSMTLCHPLPFLLHITPLEREQRHHRKGYDHLLHACRGRRRDVRPAGCVSPVTSGLVRPFLPLYRHPRHCNVIPSTAGTQVDGTSPRPPLCGLRTSVSPALEPMYEHQPNKSSSTATLEAAPGRAQDSPGRPLEARFVRTTVDSTTLWAMLPHVPLRSTRHDYKPPPLSL